MIGMAMGKVDDADVKTILSNINHVRVITMDDCSKKVRKNFAEDVTKLNRNGYEEMVRANDNGEKRLIMTKMKGDDITKCSFWTMNPMNVISCRFWVPSKAGYRQVGEHDGQQEIGCRDS